jgi:SAM-dependent methyltransferase/ADP-ribose pyrophosphatase YjhB (NUDIX family)
MPDLLSAALFQRGGLALVTHRKPGRGPFAGHWLLPTTTVPDSEAAEDALRRHAREQFSLTLGEAQFVETVYLEDDADQRRYVANIFRAVMEGGPLRFNAEGDYDDARWLGPDDLAQLDMPEALRDPLVRILADPDYTPQTDWSVAGEAAPLGESAMLAAALSAALSAAPDNRAGWDAIAAAYQRDRFGDRYADSLMWSWHLREDDVRLLGDIRGKRVLALGCGGGQDVVALSKMGAVAVGIDASEKQIDYAKEYAQRHGAQNASFAVGSVEDLSRFDDESFDAAVAAHMLNYVQRIDDTLREVHRVLRGGGVLAISVRHPFDVMLSDAAPYRIERAYWDTPVDWTWEFGSGESGRFRQWYWTVSQWFDLLNRAGFAVERLQEPREDADAGEGIDAARGRLVPYTLLIKARKR